MRSKKVKSKIDKIKRKSRKKVNSQTKMKKTGSRKTRSRKTRVNKMSRIRRNKRRMRGGSNLQQDYESLFFHTEYLESIMGETDESGLTENEKAIKGIIEMGKNYDITIIDLAIAGATENKFKSFIDKISKYVIGRIRDKRLQTEKTVGSPFSKPGWEEQYQKYLKSGGDAAQSNA